MNILLTGGNGFIGSNTAIELVNSGYKVIIVDNLSNSTSNNLSNLGSIIDFKFYNVDITNKENLKIIFEENNIAGVIHFAAYKSVGESVSNPLKYYNNNIVGLINILDVMIEYDVKKFIFSSSATVYGNPKTLPISEDFDINILNPYGRTKLIGENILQDLAKANPKLKIIILRYFNPVGAHSSGLIGENPVGIPNNLFPYILDVIKGKREKLTIYGSDYDTVDGTGVRDYLHVTDLAKGHLAALTHLDNGVRIYNLGTGRGYSVLEVIEAFNNQLNKEDNKENKGKLVKYCFGPRREGDSASVYADCSLAKKELGWVAMLGLNEMVRDSLKFLNNN